jgi:hypothetical protein
VLIDVFSVSRSFLVEVKRTFKVGGCAEARNALSTKKRTIAR